ncbi:exo-beta-N-acetylmuramidase NamZ family protein [Flexithrix dorotheae]|uniref:exo-beta-N-acetylmuramidase NamZ family protein n=1 Tax=Flexithrix dorotheae TaxID=70993 RepID=UPI000367CB5C|nr:DUF1343 domain-containing protein [Flexithrix dorotheae]
MRIKFSLIVFFLGHIYSSCTNTTASEINSTNLEKSKTIVKTGIEVLRDRNFKELAGKKVGLITNTTGVDRNLKSTVDILFEANNVELKVLMGPEHGVRGDHSAGEWVPFYKDPKTNLPVYSLYGKSKKPSPEMLEGIDVLVYDIQDIGCRSYTYISTMGLAMEAAAEQNIEFVVLDRPNPIGGNRVEGNLVEEGYLSFVSQFKIPYLYGLTCGELAGLLNEEGLLSNQQKCKLTIIEMDGWTREMTFEQTGLQWVPTSPHIPHKDSPFFYPMAGILGELYSVSIGVGYTLPFQTFAADWIDPIAFAEKMNGFGMEGIVFRPISFKPYYSSMKGIELNGVQVHITDHEKVNLSAVQFYFMQANHELYPEKNPFELCEPSRLDMFDKVCGSNKIREIFTQDFNYEKVKWYWEKDVDTFKAMSKPYYLY